MTKPQPNRMTRNFASTGDGEHGPSYYDCRQLADEIERTFGCRVMYILEPANASRRWTDPLWWCRARAYHFQHNPKKEVYVAGQFGGNAGAKTFPGALLGALLGLYERCDEDKAKAWLNDALAPGDTE